MKRLYKSTLFFTNATVFCHARRPRLCAVLQHQCPRGAWGRRPLPAPPRPAPPWGRGEAAAISGCRRPKRGWAGQLGRLWGYEEPQQLGGASGWLRPPGPADHPLPPGEEQPPPRDACSGLGPPGAVGPWGSWRGRGLQEGHERPSSGRSTASCAHVPPLPAEQRGERWGSADAGFPCVSAPWKSCGKQCESELVNNSIIVYTLSSWPYDTHPHVVHTLYIFVRTLYTVCIYIHTYMVTAALLRGDTRVPSRTLCRACQHSAVRIPVCGGARPRASSLFSRCPHCWGSGAPGGAGSLHRRAEKERK